MVANWIERAFPTKTRLLALACAVLVALNGAIAWPLFEVEYVDYPQSVEGFFIALVQFYRTQWAHGSWYPYWNAGIPLASTYQPLLHVLGAIVASIADVSSARGYHIALASLYACGSMTIALLVYWFTKRVGYAFSAGILYSLISPSNFLVSEIRGDTGSLWGARRLYSAVAWGDGPHVASLAFVPLAIIGIDLYARDRRKGSLLIGGLLVSLVFLTNIPGTLVLAMAALAYITASPLATLPRTGFRVATVGAFGYALCCAIVPPSVLLLVNENVKGMTEGGWNTSRLIHFGVTIFGLVGLRWLTRRLSFHSRIFVAFVWIQASLVLGFYWFGSELIAQPGRFHLGMELGLSVLVVLLVNEVDAILTSRPRTIAVCVAIAAFVFVQFPRYRQFARERIQPLDMTTRGEYRVAQWFTENAEGVRVYASGSTSFWLNAFTDTPQLIGCCTQNQMLWPLKVADYVIRTDDGVGEGRGETSRLWLQAFGVRYVHVSGPESDDVYKPFRHWQKFDGVLREVWSQRGDVIYETGIRSLAHAITRDEMVDRAPVNGIDIEPILDYAAATVDTSRPVLQTEWVNNYELRVTGEIEPGMIVSIQTPYHPGWRAHQDGKAVRTWSDKLGLLIVEPRAAGPLRLSLHFTGGMESYLTAFCSVTALLLGCGLLLWGSRRRTSRLQ